jgi:S-(hydroxymethyl)glutathione dehydrogenase/alcohol dehydrogenase
MQLAPTLQKEICMQTKAAVLYEPKKPLVIEQVELDAPKDHEVLVRMASSGVCRSDYHAMVGEWTMPLPMILGHEAAGVVEAVGAGVTKSKPGDHVILNFRPNCGWCKYCVNGRPVLCNGSDTPRWVQFDGTSRLHIGDQAINAYARLGSFSQYAVVPESGAVPVRHDMPLDRASLIGCSVTTGVCAVTNAAKVEPGSTVVVLGLGGVGLSVITGAVLAGASQIIAVDLLENKLAYGKEFGATHVIDASTGDVAAKILDMTNGGVDYAFDAFGSAETIETCYNAVHLGGTVCVVGMAPEDQKISINALSIPRSEKVIMGTWYGSARPWHDLPKMVDLYMAGKIKVDEMLTRSYPIEQINEAYAALEKGENARAILTFD